MGSNLEPVPVTSQKHDPAWNHCEMYKNGDRVQLKCTYCGKMFKGGGIHRIKEHLAGQKGNASTCLRVLPEVRLLMQESLNGAAMKKRKKQKLMDEMVMMNAHSAHNGHIEALPLSSRCELSSDVVGLLPVSSSLDQNLIVLDNREEGMSSKGMGRKKKGRIRKASKHVVSSTRLNDQFYTSIARFLLDAKIPFEAVKSSYFQPMIDAIAAQEVGVQGPSYHELRSWVLKNLIHEVKNEVDQCSGTWARTGCSVLVDELRNEKGKLVINFLVYSPQGTIFLKSVDMPETINSSDAVFELIKQVVEEVGVKNVLQVITGCEERYVEAGRRLTETHPTVFWTPCAARCIDMMLDDIKNIGWINLTLGHAKDISRFIYNNSNILNLMRRYTCGVDLVDTGHAKDISRFIYNNSNILNLMRRYTCGVDLVDTGVTSSSTDFSTLKRMASIKQHLHSMFTSEEWMESDYSKKPEGYKVLDSVCNQPFWSDCMLITRLTEPLLRLLRIVSSEKRCAMGYVYAGLYRAKEMIKRELSESNDYSVFRNIIDHRWGYLHRHPLHAAGFYLNPKFFYSTEEDMHLSLRSLVYDCIEKLVPDPKLQDRIVTETSSYRDADGDFGRKMAIRARESMLPAEWWSTYGGGCPNLSRLAIRILSQTCSLISNVKPDKVLFEQMHEASNALERRRLKDIVFLQTNLRLREQKNREQGPIDPISYENVAFFKEWVSETEICSDEPASSDWTTLDPPFGNAMDLVPPIDDFEALDAGFGDCEIFDSVKDIKDDNGDDSS